MEIINDATYIMKGKELKELAHSIAVELISNREIVGNVQQLMLGSDNRPATCLNGLNARLLNVFNENNIYTIQDIINIGREGFMRYRNLGRNSITILSRSLKELGHYKF